MEFTLHFKSRWKQLFSVSFFWNVCFKVIIAHAQRIRHLHLGGKSLYVTFKALLGFVGPRMRQELSNTVMSVTGVTWNSALREGKNMWKLNHCLVLVQVPRNQTWKKSLGGAGRGHMGGEGAHFSAPCFHEGAWAGELHHRFAYLILHETTPTQDGKSKYIKKPISLEQGLLPLSEAPFWMHQSWVLSWIPSGMWGREGEASRVQVNYFGFQKDAL